MISTQLAKEMHDYFCGKIVTILTSQTALPLTKETHPDWFTIEVAGVDQEAIWGIDIKRGTKQLFFLPVLGIVEEQVLLPDHPKYNEVKSKIELKQPIKNKEVKSADQEVIKSQCVACPATSPQLHQIENANPSQHAKVEDLQKKSEMLKQQWKTSHIKHIPPNETKK